MIGFLWDHCEKLWAYLSTNFDPFRDTADILLVALGVYWLLLLMRGTRATLWPRSVRAPRPGVSSCPCGAVPDHTHTRVTPRVQTQQI